MKKKKDLSKKFWFVIITISSILIVLIAIGFAVFKMTKRTVIEKNETGGKVLLNYTNNITGLKIVDMVPVSDTIGKKNSKAGEYYDFSVDVTLDNATYIEYELAVTKDKKFSTVSDEDIRIYLEQEKSGTYTEVLEPSAFIPLKEVTDIGTQKGDMVLYRTKRTKNGTDRYRLRMWVSDKSLIEKGNYNLEVTVKASANNN